MCTMPWWAGPDAPLKTLWVTYRRARQLGFTDKEIDQLEHMRIEAPNGINWAAYKVRVS